VKTVLSRVQEHHAAGADHVCIQVLSDDFQDFPDTRTSRASFSHPPQVEMSPTSNVLLPCSGAACCATTAARKKFAEVDNSKPLTSARELRGQFSDLALKQLIIFLSIRKHAAEPGMKLPRTRLPRNINGIGSVDPAAGKYKDAILRRDYKSRPAFRSRQVQWVTPRRQNRLAPVAVTSSSAASKLAASSNAR